MPRIPDAGANHGGRLTAPIHRHGSPFFGLVLVASTVSDAQDTRIASLLTGSLCLALKALPYTLDRRLDIFDTSKARHCLVLAGAICLLVSYAMTLVLRQIKN